MSAISASKSQNLLDSLKYRERKKLILAYALRRSQVMYVEYHMSLIEADSDLTQLSSISLINNLINAFSPTNCGKLKKLKRYIIIQVYFILNLLRDSPSEATYIY